MTARWDGSQWRRVPAPDPGNIANLLNAITAAPESSELFAVGYWQNSGFFSQPFVLAARLPAASPPR